MLFFFRKALYRTQSSRFRHKTINLSDKNDIKQLLVRDPSQRDSTVNVVLIYRNVVFLGIGRTFTKLTSLDFSR